MTVKRPAAANGSRAGRGRGGPPVGSIGDPVDGPADQPETAGPVVPPRLARYRLELPSGHEVGVAVCGEGVPLVVVHGFAAEGILYAQTLSRLVRMGFRVIAVDSPGHGATDSVATLAPLAHYAGLVGETLDHLGVGAAVLAGHSMGGRLVAELGATDPGRCLALILLDAIVGDVWDRMARLFRVVPMAYAGFGLSLLADTVATLPLWSNPRQAVKLARLVFPTGAHHVRRPWRLAGPLVSIVRSGPSGPVLDRVRDHGVPTYVIHGDWDLPVPICTARSAARRSGGELVTVHGANHSWLLRDPETFPAILAQLLAGELGPAISGAVGATSFGAGDLVARAEARLYEPDALVRRLTPATAQTRPTRRHRTPRYRWTRSTPGV